MSAGRLMLVGATTLAAAFACAAEGLTFKPIELPKVADKPPRMLRGSCVRPEFPWQSIQNKESGMTTVRLRVDDQGKVLRASIERSSGFVRLDTAAEEALSLCRFEPARDGQGKAVNGTALVDYAWRLEDVPKDPWTALRALQGGGRAATANLTAVPFIDRTQANAEQRTRILRGVQEAALKNAGCNSIEGVQAIPDPAALAAEPDAAPGQLRIVRELWTVQQCGYPMRYALLMLFPDRASPSYEMTPISP